MAEPVSLFPWVSFPGLIADAILDLFGLNSSYNKSANNHWVVELNSFTEEIRALYEPDATIADPVRAQRIAGFVRAVKLKV
jgi:hypothetical protein